MATADPMHPTYQGAVAGRDRARMAPVTTADRSPKVARRPRIAVNSASAARQLTIHMKSCLTAIPRKFSKAAKIVGQRAMSTSLIMVKEFMLAVCTWGDGATFNSGWI